MLEIACNCRLILERTYWGSIVPDTPIPGGLCYHTEQLQVRSTLSLVQCHVMIVREMAMFIDFWCREVPWCSFNEGRVLHVIMDYPANFIGRWASLEDDSFYPPPSHSTSQLHIDQSALHPPLSRISYQVRTLTLLRIGNRQTVILLRLGGDTPRDSQGRHFPQAFQPQHRLCFIPI